jgi:hypothetical protein
LKETTISCKSFILSWYKTFWYFQKISVNR